MRVWPVVAAAAFAAPVVGSAAKAPDTYLVTVSGTVTVDATIDDDATYEGTSCKVHIVNKGHDTIEYATVKPLRLTVSGGKAAARATVPFKYHLSGTQEEGTPTGTLPNGSPCPPLPLLPVDCRTYSGNLALSVEVDGKTVTVSSPQRAFQPSGLCPGAHGIEVPDSTGRLPAKASVAVVNGTGKDTWTPPRQGGSIQLTSLFRARFVRQ